jgi:hypothetical protein
VETVVPAMLRVGSETFVRRAALGLGLFTAGRPVGQADELLPAQVGAHRRSAVRADAIATAPKTIRRFPRRTRRT